MPVGSGAWLGLRSSCGGRWRLRRGAAETQGDAIARAAELVLDAKVFWVFGTGHSHVIAEELYGRAGGLSDVQAVLEPGLMLHEGLLKSSLLERLSGLADVLLQTNDIGPGDVVLIVSSSGRNAVPVEFAIERRPRAR